MKSKEYISCTEIGADNFFINRNNKKENNNSYYICEACGGKAYKETYNDLSTGHAIKMEIVRCREKQCKKTVKRPYREEQAIQEPVVTPEKKIIKKEEKESAIEINSDNIAAKYYGFHVPQELLDRGFKYTDFTVYETRSVTLTPQKVVNIVKDLFNGESITLIQKKYQVERNHFYRIKRKFINIYNERNLQKGTNDTGIEKNNNNQEKSEENNNANEMDKILNEAYNNAALIELTSSCLSNKVSNKNNDGYISDLVETVRNLSRSLLILLNEIDKQKK